MPSQGQPHWRGGGHAEEETQWQYYARDQLGSEVAKLQAQLQDLGFSPGLLTGCLAQPRRPCSPFRKVPGS